MKKFFRTHPELIYLNSGSHSLVPLSVIQEVKAELDLYEQNPTAGMFQAWQKLWSVQKQIAPHFGANPKNFFFRANVTQPLNEFILGVKLPPASEILTSDQEYGAVFNICRFRAERDSLNLKTFTMPSRQEISEMTADDLVDRVVSSFTPKTKMLVISEIFTGSGVVVPLEKIGREARARGIFTVIDGAHSPGFLKLDLENSSLDFYAGNLHKWWMGPKGTGFGWARRESFTELQPIQAGWISYDLQEPFASFAEGDPQAIRSLMLGCHDFSPFFALLATLKFWQEQGQNQIFSLKRALDNHLISEAERILGFPRFASKDSQMQGPLHSFLMPEKFSKIVFTKLIEDLLEQTKVQCSINFVNGEMYLRLSPHIYNNKDEITEALLRLKKFFTL